MNRCARPVHPSIRRRALACALLCAASGALAPLDASAQQVQRRFPQSALRGKIVFTHPPAIELDGDAAMLAPGVRIHDPNNMMLVTGAVGGDGNKYVVDYRMESTGLLSEIWLLTKTEAEVHPWPRTPADAAAWTFDYMAQTWTKP